MSEPARTSVDEAGWSSFDLVLAPTRGLVSLQLDELWHHRELLWFLAWRDLKVRYKQTVLGASWAILQPFLTMVVFSIFFGRLGGLSRHVEGGIAYPLFAFSGLVPWTFFAHVLQRSSDSLVGSAHLIRKVYFPRLLMPIASVVTGLVDFLFAFATLLLMMVWYGRSPSLEVVLLPAFVMLAIATALGAGLWLSALNVQFRDVHHLMGFLLQLWMFATPIAYPATLLAEPWRTVYGLNPMVGVVEGFRWALLGAAAPGPALWVSIGMALALLVTGAFYFRRMERGFADDV